jgi:hypothetical protein
MDANGSTGGGPARPRPHSTRALRGRLGPRAGGSGGPVSLGTGRDSLVVAVVAGMVLFARAARAIGPVDVEVAGMGGATNLASSAGNELGFEAGARAGVSWRHVYGGLSFVDSPTVTMSARCVGPVVADCTTATTSTVAFSVRSMRYGLDAGYDFRLLSRFIVRPQLGVGRIALYQSSPVQVVASDGLQGLDGTAHDVYLEPGVTAVLSLWHFFLGVDANALFVPELAHSRAALTAHGQLGVRF